MQPEGGGGETGQQDDAREERPDVPLEVVSLERLDCNYLSFIRTNIGGTVRIAQAPPDITPNYKSMVVVGGKMYYSLAEARKYREPWEPSAPYFATAGSNIVSKGDAYGLGLTESNDARAFVNAGEDYLLRGEAPVDISGAIADAGVDDQSHAVAITYDRETLRLYVDGAVQSSTPYRMKIGENPFPVTIGDGFVGVIDEVAIYDHALSGGEILAANKIK
jgi:hypothetical protein